MKKTQENQKIITTENQETANVWDCCLIKNQNWIDWLSKSWWWSFNRLIGGSTYCFSSVLPIYYFFYSPHKITTSRYIKNMFSRQCNTILGIHHRLQRTHCDPDCVLHSFYFENRCEATQLPDFKRKRKMIFKDHIIGQLVQHFTRSVCLHNEKTGGWGREVEKACQVGWEPHQ